LFLQDARKIVPSLKYKDLHFGKGLGGIRPQVVNTITKKLEMGEAEIVGGNILFNITPSPGASVSLKNAEQDTLKIIGFFKSKFNFDQKRWCEDFGSTMTVCKE
jgi:malate dehydrogenase (quinone)